LCGSDVGFPSAAEGVDAFPLAATAVPGGGADLTGGGIGPSVDGALLGNPGTGGGVEDRLTGGPPTKRGFAVAGGAITGEPLAGEGVVEAVGGGD